MLPLHRLILVFGGADYSDYGDVFCYRHKGKKYFIKYDNLIQLNGNINKDEYFKKRVIEESVEIN